MKKINLNFVFPLLVLIILVTGLSRQMFNLPPLGKLLDPFCGVVQNQRDGALEHQADIGKLHLQEQVQVYFDARKVPHIYARNKEDLYFAQGYVAASLRLWQMDFITYASAGRLSEIFRDGFLDYDRTQRRIGIPMAAEASLKKIAEDTASAKVLAAYTRGVNAYIESLSYRDLPLEYKLLDYTPEKWTDLKTVLIMKYMANLLSGYEDDFSLTNLMIALGEKKFNLLFPVYPERSTPVMRTPAASAAAGNDFLKRPDYLDYSFLTSDPVIPVESYNPRLGSNSWAVSGRRTRSGHPILCNDPHLNLSLPAIWLEMQLNCPGMNVYGVSIPGVPSIIIGFNDHIAWGLTNGADDVKDWYKLKITRDYKKYEFGGQWLDLRQSVEEIRRRGQKPFMDTIYHTVQGPIVSDRNFGGRYADLRSYALKWELHNPSDEFLTFIQLNRARNYQDFKEAVRHYRCPVQNFTFAGQDDTIAVIHQGNMAVKWAGQGKFILDGSRRDHLTDRYIPEDSLPHEVNPASSYVLSANQQPTGKGYPYYYNGYYFETRANRIGQMLDTAVRIDIATMQAMQLDNVSSMASDALPILLSLIDTGKCDRRQKAALAGLREWNASYDLNSTVARLFDLWWSKIREFTWDEFSGFTFHARLPSDGVLLGLLQNDLSNEYFDRAGTAIRETGKDIVGIAFQQAFSVYEEQRKNGDGRWGDLHTVNILHPTNLPAFSRMNIPSSGCPDAINAISSNWGPSWRMIVEMGDRPKAYGIYPGGQSGEPGSPYYDNFVQDWIKGNYYSLDLFTAPEAKAHASAAWILH